MALRIHVDSFSHTIDDKDNKQPRSQLSFDSTKQVQAWEIDFCTENATLKIKKTQR